MDLSIIIVSWNVCDLLAACLHSIEAFHGALRTEVIVVDSASSDGSADMVSEKFPSVNLLRQAENVGFVRGNNIGLEASTGRYLMLLNPDTEVHAHALSRLVDYLEDNSGVGIVGPHTLNPDRTHQSTRRRFPSLLTGLFESTWMETFAPRAILDRYYVRDLPDEGTYDVDWVQGSAMMVRREVYDEIGGMDPGYVMYSEELDWCKRATLAGWRVAYVGNAYITHHYSQSADQVVTHKHVQFQKSKLRYFRKFHGVFAELLLRVVLIGNYAAQVLLEGVKLMAGSKPGMRQERVRSYAAVLRSLLGFGVA